MATNVLLLCSFCRGSAPPP